MRVPSTIDHAAALPPVADHDAWAAARARLRAREKAAARELDAIGRRQSRQPWAAKLMIAASATPNQRADAWR